MERQVCVDVECSGTETRFIKSANMIVVLKSVSHEAVKRRETNLIYGGNTLVLELDDSWSGEFMTDTDADVIFL